MSFREFKDKGYTIINSKKFKFNPEDIRLELENLFNINNTFDTLFAEDKLSETIEKFLDSISNQKDNLDLIKNLYEEYNKSFLFPPIHFMRNYFPTPLQLKESWHTDSGGETRYSFCNERLKNNKYTFGKVGYYFQENSKIWGGGIDLIPSDHRRRKLQGGYRYKILKFCNFILRKTRLSKRYFSSNNKWLEEQFDILSKKINTNQNQIILFDARVPHRGSYIGMDALKELNLKSDDIENNRIKKNLKTKNKYAFYSHFGNKLGLESFLYDRSRRKDRNEIGQWKRQYEKYIEFFGEESYEVFIKTVKKLSLEHLLN